MAKVSYVDIPSGLETAYKKGLQAGDRFQFSRTRVKNLFLSRTRVKGITQKSQLIILAPIWQAFISTVKDAWNSAGLASKLTGWKLFVYDTVARRKAGLSGFATPNDTYQAMVGRILVESPATGLQLEQAHPLTYYVQKKVTGTRSQYSVSAITESFSLPLELSLSYKTDLTGLSGGAFAKAFCRIYSSYQGLTIETDLQIDLGLSTDWTRSSASISSVRGVVRAYSVFIEVYNARGNLYFDNVSIIHNSENWARDPNCNNISQAFTKAFFQVARHWVATNISDGADFGSIYSGLIT